MKIKRFTFIFYFYIFFCILFSTVNSANEVLIYNRPYSINFCKQLLISKNIDLRIKSKNGWLRVIKNNKLNEYTSQSLSTIDIKNINICIMEYNDICFDLNNRGEIQ
jgi:hypothetical protein